MISQAIQHQRMGCHKVICPHKQQLSCHARYKSCKETSKGPGYIGPHGLVHAESMYPCHDCTKHDIRLCWLIKQCNMTSMHLMLGCDLPAQSATFTPCVVQITQSDIKKTRNIGPHGLYHPATLYLCYICTKAPIWLRWRPNNHATIWQGVFPNADGHPAKTKTCHCI